jgi:hypothetical protein
MGFLLSEQALLDKSLEFALPTLQVQATMRTRDP